MTTTIPAAFLAPAAIAARHGLQELLRREDIRAKLRRDGFSTAAYDSVTAELRAHSALACMDASKEANAAGCYPGALQWLEEYARQEFLADRTRLHLREAGAY